MCCSAVPLLLWAALPSLHTHTTLSLSTSFWRSLLVPYYLLHDTSDFHTLHKLGTTLLLLLYTILVLVIVPLLGHLFHSVPLLFSLALLLSSSSTLAVLLVAWPHMPSLLHLLFSIFFLLPALFLLQGMLAPSVSAPFIALPHTLPLPSSPIMGTLYICASSPYT